MPAFRSLRLRLCAAALCLLLAGGCSMVRIGYGHFDSVATWMAHDWFDLDAAQRDDFARRFERLHAWHRYGELPEYARFLEAVQQRARRGLRAADMLWLVDGFRQRYARIAAQGAADAAALLATLTPVQVAAFRQQLDRANRKFLSEHRSEEDEAARRRIVERRLLSRLHDWVGPLSDTQEARVTALARALPLVDRLRHRDRLRRQHELLALLELRGGERKVFTQRLREWLVHWEAGRDPAEEGLFADSWNKRAEMWEAIDRMLTPAQRDHLVQRLQDYIDDFRHLAEPRRGVTWAP